MQYMALTAPLHVVEKNLGYLRLTWSTSDLMDHIFCGNEINHPCCEGWGILWSSKIIVSKRSSHLTIPKPSYASVDYGYAMASPLLLFESILS